LVSLAKLSLHIRDANSSAYFYRNEFEKAAQYFNFIMSEKTSTFTTRSNLHEFLINRVINKDSSGLYLEFGVSAGASINMFAKAMPNITIHGFDAFRGLRNAWSKPNRSIGAMDLHGKIPKVPSNVALHIGWVEDTLPLFLQQHAGKIYFVHQDLDVYSPTKSSLKLLKDRFESGTMILFDDYHGFIGWENHSHKAFNEVLNIEEFELLAFSFDGAALFRKI
jgi:hypothetical protein